VTVVAKIINSTYHTQGETHIPLFRTFAGTEPEMTLKQTMQTIMSTKMDDNYNVNIVQIGEHLLTISDMTGAKELDRATLETKGQHVYHDALSKEPLSMITCAHPTQLPFDKFVYNYVVTLRPTNMKAFYMTQFYRIDTTKEPLEREVVFNMTSDKPPPYMHQFAHTPNYFILFEYPLWWHEMEIPLGTKVLPHMEWNPALSDGGTKVKVIDKRTWTLVREFTTDPFFAYHHVNAYEEGGHAVVEIMTVPCELPSENYTIQGKKPMASCLHMNAFNMETLKTAGFEIPRGSLRRFLVPTTDMSRKSITFQDVNQFGMDLKAIHPALKGFKHRYIWSMGNHASGGFSGVWWNSILKIDTATNTTLTWWKDDHYPSEVSFLPRPGATEEDDGVLISTVLGAPLGRSYLLVLNATDLTQIATADAPEFLPFPSHGHSCAPVKGQKICFWG